MTIETMKIRITLIEEMLGTASGNPELHREYIASKAPDAEKREEEVARLGADEVAEKQMTIFPRDEHGQPFLWDYQIRGFFKDACGGLRTVPSSKSKALTSYKKKIDRQIFAFGRRIPIQFGGEVGNCQRSLRAQTPQGERVALAESETVPEGSVIELKVGTLDPAHWPVIREWLNYGVLSGLGCWRNSGKGKFVWEQIGEIEKEDLEELQKKAILARS